MICCWICCWIGSLTSQTRIFQLYIWGLVQADWNCIVLLLNWLLHVTINDISVIHLVFPISPKNTKLGIWRWDLVSRQISLNSVQWFQRRSRKCLNLLEVRAAILFFRSAQKHKLGRGRWDLASWQFSFNQFRSGERSKMSQPIRGRGGHFVFPILAKSTNLVEDVKILVPVKFRWIPFSGFREEVENLKSFWKVNDNRWTDGRTANNAWSL